MDSTLATDESEINAEPVLEELVAKLDWRFYAEVLGILALFLAIMAYIQYVTPAIVGNDGYYHIRMAELIRQQGLKPPFIWMPLTILNAKDFYDHHMLYHVILALFIPGDPREPVADASLFTAAKWASIVIPVLAFVAIWYMLRRQGVRWAWLWALGLFAVSDAFIYRMSMVRAQALSLLILVVGLHWLLKRRYRLLLPLGFLYVWSYNAFPLLAVIAVVVFVATWITEKKFEWEALIWPIAGIILGLILNPYFPKDLKFIFEHLLPKFGANPSGLGIEWEPYNTWILFQNSTLMFFLIPLGIFALGWQNRPIDRSQLVGLLLICVFGVMLIKSRRFIEYAPAFVLIFTALACRPMIQRFITLLPTVNQWPVLKSVAAGLALAVLLVALAVIFYRAIDQARTQVDTSQPASYMADGVHWLKEHAPPGAMIFQTDWDDFTQLFFYDTDQIYLVGLDPTYLQLADPGLYNLWVAITRGQVQNPSKQIAADFGHPLYVFSDTQHTAFMNLAADDPGLKEVYHDNEVVIYEVLANTGGHQ